MSYDRNALYLQFIVIGLMCSCGEVSAADSTPASEASTASGVTPPRIASASPTSGPAPTPKKHRHFPGTVGPGVGMVTENQNTDKETFAKMVAGSSAVSGEAPAKGTKRANVLIAQNVRRALTKTQGLDVSNITVRARGGTVTLKGAVPDDEQVSRAAAAAAGVPGVTSVQNHIKIGGE